MRRLYSVFFHYFQILSPNATYEQISEGSFWGLLFALYFPLTWLVDLLEWFTNRSIGIVGTVTVWVVLSVGMYRVLLAGDRSKNIIARYPVKPVSKAYVQLWLGVLIILAVCIVCFPLGRQLRGLPW